MENFKNYSKFVNEYGRADHAPTTQIGIPLLTLKGEISPDDSEKMERINSEIEYLRKAHKRSGHTERFVEMIDLALRGERMPREQFYVASGGKQFGIKLVNSLVSGMMPPLKIEKERNKMFVVSNFSDNFTKQYTFEMRGKLLGKKLGLMD